MKGYDRHMEGVSPWGFEEPLSLGVALYVKI